MEKDPARVHHLAPLGGWRSPPTLPFFRPRAVKTVKCGITVSMTTNLTPISICDKEDKSSQLFTVRHPLQSPSKTAEYDKPSCEEKKAMAWSRLIRFQDDARATRFGEPLIESAEDLHRLLEKGELYADEFEGTSPFALTGRGAKRPVKKILGILAAEDVPIVRCIGLNYMKHI